MADVSRLGRRLRLLRERKGWSQYELARQSGVGRATIVSVDSGGRASLSLDNAAKIARALGVTLDSLVYGDILDEESDLAAAMA